MEEPSGLQSMGSLRVRHNWATSLSFFTFHFHALEKEMATHSIVLAWRIPGTGEPGGLPSMGLHRVGHDWSDLAAAVATAWRRLLSSCRLMFPGVRSSLVFSDLDLSLLLLVFSLIFTVVSRLLQYSTVDKTSRLKMKSFSTVRDTQRGSQSYMEKRRGRRELDVTLMRWSSSWSSLHSVVSDSLRPHG